MNSILTSIKKMLGIEQDYDHFDQEIIININSVFMNLTQFGIGPDEGFSISGATEEWKDLIGDNKKLAAVKSYIYLKVRLLFDPPSNSFLIDSMERQIKELEWRLNAEAEGGTTIE